MRWRGPSLCASLYDPLRVRLLRVRARMRVSLANAAEIVEEPAMDAVTVVPEPRNEPVRGYAPGSAERESLTRRLGELAAGRIDLTMTIAGHQRMGGGDAIDVVQPHKHRHVLGVTHNATNSDVAAAVTAAKEAAPGWRALPFEERAAIFLRAADLLAGPWRDTLNA